jgi:hypothetical protein
VVAPADIRRGRQDRRTSRMVERAVRRTKQQAAADFFAGILSVITMGVLLIAYGLLSPRLTTADGIMIQRPIDLVRAARAVDT